MTRIHLTASGWYVSIRVLDDWARIGNAAPTPGAALASARAVYARRARLARRTSSRSARYVIAEARAYGL